MTRFTLPVFAVIISSGLLMACSEQKVSDQATETALVVGAAPSQAELATRAEAEQVAAKAAELAAAEAEKRRVEAEVAEQERLQMEAEAKVLAAKRLEHDRIKRQAETAVRQAQEAADAQLAAQEATMEIARAEAAQKATAEQAARDAAKLEQERLDTEAEALKQAEAEAYAKRDRVIAAGTFTKKKKTIRGTWSIVMEGGHRVLRFDEQFKTKWVDDLQVFLSPLLIVDATGKNAGLDVIRIAPLQSRSGAQEYAIPDDIDLDIYQSLLIHCEAYNLLWGGADIH
ncbi:MAG: hypothetical protein COA47_09875 [Robiginitomaculum sp.]|nr:MAG: hypothetical protein COA47_09875 [Robiginitomaculum sp.]